MLIYAVDDEKSALFFLEEKLREVCPEAEILTFADTDKLFEKFIKKEADIVFLDIEMPEINGIEVAKRLKSIKDKINIVFVTGYSEYATEAFDIYASGYILKPCKAENLKKVLSNLRYPIEDKKDIFIKTFGNFDVFLKGNPIAFRSQKSKEMLAYLVDREGALVSRQEIAGALFEEDFSHSLQVRLTKFATRLSEDLEEVGLYGFFINENGYRVDLSNAECDFVEYLKGNPTYQYSGEYMEQYSFAEYKKNKFEK